MNDFEQLESVFASAGLDRRPVAVLYRNEEPSEVPKFHGSVPSGCTFWRLAAEGATFYTVPSDHFNCTIGSYTHSIALPAEREAELPATLELMTGIGYLRMEDVPDIARLPEAPAAVIYAPLADSPGEPDVVVFAGSPGRLMWLEEAAGRAGSGVQMALGRPTCMALPAAMKNGVVASSGCVGNRVYTALADSTGYLIVSGQELAKIAAELPTIVEANHKLEEFHRQRAASLTSV